MERPQSLNFDLSPLFGSGIDDLDKNRVLGFYNNIRGFPVLPPWDEREEWEIILDGSGILTGVGNGVLAASVGGLLLFGRNPRKHLAQSGIEARAFRSQEKYLDSIERTLLNVPLSPLYAPQNRHQILESGLIQAGVDFIGKYCLKPPAERSQQERIWEYPEEAVREIIANAVIHRDYSVARECIEISIFSNRLEIVSPGALPDGVTEEKMLAGFRFSRNQLIVNICRDYGLIRHEGKGVSKNILAACRKSGLCEPEFILDEAAVKVILWKNV